MHTFLRSIGFKKLNKDDLKALVVEIDEHPDAMEFIIDQEGNQLVELRREVAYGMGLALRGFYDDEDKFQMEYYYPYLEGHNVSTKVPIEIIKQSDKESYQGLCEDLRLGIDLIFYIQDMISFLQSNQAENDVVDFGGVKLSALATDGKILLPIKTGSREDIDKANKAKKKRNELLAAAKEGDSKAIENLTLGDMDTYSMISRRLETEDVLSIVHTTFMPNGIECDKYSILGDIVGYKNFVNKLSMELVHVITVSCNDLVFDVAINGTDLLGEPLVGRRFKGNIWMQGKIQ